MRFSRFVLGTAAAIGICCALPVTASAAIINFDVDGFGAPIAANTPITNQYANLGVTFLGLENGSPVNVNAAPDPNGVPAPSSPNVMTNCSNASTFCPSGNRADVLQIFFAAAASGISLQLDSLGNDSVTFNLYDALDVLLETQTVTSNGSLYIPVNFTASGVSRIDGLQPNDGWAWAFDDLTFDATAVPEPLTLSLFGAGVVGAAAMRRRNKAKTA